VTRYTVKIRTKALKALGALPRATRDEIQRAIDALAEEPRPAGVKALQGRKRLWRVRLGAYRVVYSIQDEVLLVLVVRIGHRRDVYRGM